MRIIRNERRIRVLSALGQYATLGGLLTLMAGLIVSFIKPEWLTVLFACVTFGILLSVVGGFFADRYVGPLARHDTLATALKGLDDNHVLLDYELPASHVLLEPGGCTVFVVKPQGGQVTYDDGRWKHRQRGKFFRQFAGQEGVGLPDAEAQHEVRKLEHWLDKHLPEVEVPVRPVIVFINSELTLEADDSPMPTLHSKKIKGWLRGPGKLKPMPEAVYRQVEEAFGARTTPPSQGEEG